jgi:hypothetical protein
MYQDFQDALANTPEVMETIYETLDATGSVYARVYPHLVDPLTYVYRGITQCSIKS